MMVRAFLREYRYWYLLYSLQTSLFLLTFYLYRLPMSYFAYAFLVSLLILVIISGGLYYRFRQRLIYLKDFNFTHDRYILTKPSDKAYLKLIQEMTERHEKEDLNRRQREENLQQIVKLWGHQMKVPLSALSLMLQTEQLGERDLAVQLQTLNHYLSNLLNYLKLNNNHSDFRFESISVRQIMVDLVKQFRVHFLTKDIQLTLEGDWQVVTDRKWLSFALAQILDNALKYNRKHGKICIRMSDKGLIIKDTGIGILPEDLPRLFEQGFTGFNGREHQKATGFGLYMTKEILDKLDLRIQIQSQIDRGTTVLISQA